jgi:hypothetical protein
MANPILAWPKSMAATRPKAFAPVCGAPALSGTENSRFSSDIMKQIVYEDKTK